jgi:hypothetical protein
MDDVLGILAKLAADFGALKEQSKKQHEETLTAIADLSTRVSALETRVGALETSVGALTIASDNQRVRVANSMKGNVEPLQPFRFDCFGRPWPAGVAQPATLLDLAVAGNETKPGLTVKSNWNREKSRAFLELAVDGYATDGGGDADENGNKARTRRMKVIQAVGGDVASVFSTQYRLT